jgi:hypothetical protein
VGSTVPSRIDLVIAKKDKLEAELRALQATEEQIKKAMTVAQQLVKRLKSTEEINQVLAENLDVFRKKSETLVRERDILKSEVDAVRDKFGLRPEVPILEGILDILKQIAAGILKATVKFPLLGKDICNALEKTPLAGYLPFQSPRHPPSQREKDKPGGME